MFYNKNLYYLLFSSKNAIFEKNLVPDLWSKWSWSFRFQDFWINHFSKTSWWNSNSLHLGTNFQKIRLIKSFLVEQPIWSLDYKINCTSKLNWADFLHAGANSHNLKGDWKFLEWAFSKIGVVSLVTGL